MSKEGFSDGKIIAFDCEATGLDIYKGEEACRFLGMGWCSGAEEGYILTKEGLRSFWENVDKDTRLVAHNGKWDQHLIARELGCSPNDLAPIWLDTQLAASALVEKPPNLKLETCCAFYCQITPWKEEEMLADMKNVAPEAVKEYCLLDCKNTHTLALELIARLHDSGQWDWFQSFQMPLSRVLAWAEYNGMGVDRDELDSQQAENTKTCASLEEDMRLEFSSIISPIENSPVVPIKKKTKLFNFGSSKQVMALLKSMNYPCIDYKGKPSVDEGVLSGYAGTHPLIDRLLELRSLEKAAGYFTGWQGAIGTDGRIHTKYNQDVAKTGRLSCSGPNLQQVPRGKTRKIFVP